MNHEKALSAILTSKKTGKTAGAAPNFAGLWTNEYQSTANFIVNGSNVTGTYTSVVSSTGGTIAGPIVGQVSGDTIAFTVLWPSTNPSITAWVGQIVTKSGTETLETLWHLVADISEAQIWYGNRFSRGLMNSRAGLRRHDVGPESSD